MPGRSNRFQTTRWSLIQSAGTQDQSESARKALAELCELYWYPLYAYARRAGAQSADAQEQVQEFMGMLVAGSFLGKASSSKGKFRSFLLKSFSHFQSDRWRKETAQKQGGRSLQVSLDLGEGERRYRTYPADHWTAERLFERQWSLTLLDATLERLRKEYCSAGRSELFERLLPHLTQDAAAKPYQAIAESLLLSETSVKVAAYRLRKRFRDVLRNEIASTIQDATPVEVDEELRWLIQTLASQ